MAKRFDQRKNEIFDPTVALVITVADENLHILPLKKFTKSDKCLEQTFGS